MTFETHHGAPKPVYYQGKRVATVHEKSDALLMFLLKARRPEVYRERYAIKAEHSLGGAVTAEIIAGLSDEKLALLDNLTSQIKAIVGGAG